MGLKVRVRVRVRGALSDERPCVDSALLVHTAPCAAKALHHHCSIKKHRRYQMVESRQRHKTNDSDSDRDRDTSRVVAIATSSVR